MSNHITNVKSTNKLVEDDSISELFEGIGLEVSKKKEEKVIPPEIKKEEPNIQPKYAGLDIGTMNIISAKELNNNVKFKRIRDVFIDLTEDQIKMLKLSGSTSYIKKDDVFYVLGDDAAHIANIFGKKLRNPLTKGVISAGEIESMEILKIMVKEVLGETEEGICYVSSPADPVDNDFDALYHQAVITDIVSSFGWEVRTTSEATAMIFSECAKEQFTGLAISFGHGMTNISLVFKAIPTLLFSVSRGGSWIDEQAAKVTGKTPSQICAIKEKGLNLNKPVGREQSALAVYYKHLIKYSITNFIQKFKQEQGNIELPHAIPIVIAGGTSLAEGFIDVVNQVIKESKGFPFQISEIRHSEDPLNSIAKGLLVMAQSE